MEEDIDEDEVMCYKALLNARKAFEKTFEDENLDPAYWAINITAYVLGADFNPLKVIEDKTYPYAYTDSTYECPRCGKRTTLNICPCN
jgi:hypothetical protein